MGASVPASHGDRPRGLHCRSYTVDRLVERAVHNLVGRLDQQVGADEFRGGREIPSLLGVSGPVDLESLRTQGVRDEGEAARRGGFDEDSRVWHVLSMPVGSDDSGQCVTAGACRRALQRAMARSGRWAAGRVSTAANAAAGAARRGPSSFPLMLSPPASTRAAADLSAVGSLPDHPAR